MPTLLQNSSEKRRNNDLIQFVTHFHMLEHPPEQKRIADKLDAVLARVALVLVAFLASARNCGLNSARLAFESAVHKRFRHAGMKLTI